MGQNLKTLLNSNSPEEDLTEKFAEYFDFMYKEQVNKSLFALHWPIRNDILDKIEESKNV